MTATTQTAPRETPEQLRRCGNCRFFDNLTETCRRRAPTIAGVPPDAFWARVDATEWCGEFEPQLRWTGK